MSDIAQNKVGQPSLLPGRGAKALEKYDEERITNIIRAFRYDGPVEFDEGNSTRTRFAVCEDGKGDKFGKIVIGSDIQQGTDVANPNAMLDEMAAIAHELTHYQRWKDKRDLPIGDLNDIDEAMTSLQAVCAFKTLLSDMQIEQLVSDALQRLVQYAKKRRETGGK